jgi:pimeloyl-ACP methyl ester carboxylesterase
MRFLRAKLVALGLALAISGTTISSAWSAPERPVVLIPGILGTRLVDAAGRAVWGERNSLLNYPKLELTPGSPGSRLKADGLVKSINVLGPFWTIHEYDSLLDRLHRLGFVDGQTLFILPYDWRKSNFDTADQLDALVRSTPALQGGKFDIVAHSMGGLVAKIWMLGRGGAARVNKAIYMGTPFRGSMNAFATLSDGWGAFANFMAGGISTVRRVTLSFPSIYELFPNYDDCCRLGDPANHTTLDIFSGTTWTQRDWLPPEYQPGGSRSAMFEQNLAKARRVGELMRLDVPNVQEIKFAGDVIDTKLWLYVPKQNQSWRNWKFSQSRGDGTVPVWSAANNFTTTAGTNPSFVEHATIFSDEWLGNKVARELVSDAPPPVRAERFDRLVLPSGTKTLSLVSVAIEPLVVAPGGAATLSIALEFEDSAVRGEIRPTATLVAQQLQLHLSETTGDSDVAVRRLTFHGDIVAPTDEDTYQIDVVIPGVGVRASYLTVLAPGRQNP